MKDKLKPKKIAEDYETEESSDKAKSILDEYLSNSDLQRDKEIWMDEALDKRKARVEEITSDDHRESEAKDLHNTKEKVYDLVGRDELRKQALSKFIRKTLGLKKEL